MDGEAMINSIKNGDQPLPRVTQVSIAGTSSTKQPPLKDKSMWFDQEKRIQKTDRLARSILIQGLPNDIYSLIDSNKTAKDLWGALARLMLGSEYGEHDRKATVLYEYETFKATEGELLLDTYIHYLQVINDSKKGGYSKDNCELNFKFLNNLQPERKQDVNDAMGSKKKTVVVTYDLLALIAEKTNVSRSKEKVVVSSDSEGKASSSSADEKISENQNKDLQDKYDVLKNQATTFEMNNKVLNEQLKELIEKNNDLLAQTKVLKDQLKVKHVVIDTRVECQEKYAKLEAERFEYMIRYSAYFNNDKQHRKQITDQEVLYDKMSVQLVELDKHQTSLLKPYVPNVILENIIIDLEDEVVNLLEKEKANLETIESLKSKGFESSENVISKSKNQNENDCHVNEQECDKVESPKVIAPGMFKLNLDTSSSVRRPKHGGVIWKKKGSSNTSNVDLSYVSHLKLNKDVKRYSRKDLLSCNNSHLGETRSAFVCNDAVNVSCNSRMCDLLDDDNFFIFDDESVRISPVSKMSFWKKPCDSMIVRSKSKLNKSLPRTVYKWLPKLQPLAEPVAKWFPKVKRQIDKISKTPNSPGPI
nr:hypothetical protein [Tanacetum cinerariifolium]